MNRRKSTSCVRKIPPRRRHQMKTKLISFFVWKVTASAWLDSLLLRNFHAVSVFRLKISSIFLQRWMVYFRLMTSLHGILTHEIVMHVIGLYNLPMSMCQRNDRRASIGGNTRIHVLIVWTEQTWFYPEALYLVLDKLVTWGQRHSDLNYYSCSGLTEEMSQKPKVCAYTLKQNLKPR